MLRRDHKVNYRIIMYAHHISFSLLTFLHAVFLLTSFEQKLRSTRVGITVVKNDLTTDEGKKKDNECVCQYC